MGVAGAGGVGDIGGARAIDAGRQAVGVVDVRPGAAGGLGGQQAAKQQGCTQGQGQQALAVFSGAFAGVVLALAAASVGLVVYSVRRRWLLAELLAERKRRAQVPA